MDAHSQDPNALSEALLCYCLCSPPPPEADFSIGGEEELSPELIEVDSLGAVAAPLRGKALSYAPEALLSFHRVIKSIHSSSLVRAVIPMRYGEVFRNRRELERSLREQQKNWQGHLSRVRDCSEMGLRLLLPGRHETALDPNAATQYATGAGFLKARKERITRQDGLSSEAREVIKTCLSAFAGLHADWTAETGGARLGADGQGLNLPAAYFLVPNQNIPSFEQAFNKVEKSIAVKLLLNGPWPPYNFVRPRPKPFLD